MKHAARGPALSGPSTPWGAAGEGSRQLPNLAAQTRSEAPGGGGRVTLLLSENNIVWLGSSEDSRGVSAVFTWKLAPRLMAPSHTSRTKDAGREEREWPWSDLPGRVGQSDVGSHFHSLGRDLQGLSGARITTRTMTQAWANWNPHRPMR